MVADTAVETHGACSGMGAVAGDDKVVGCCWSGVGEFDCDGTIFLLGLLHRGDLFVEDIFDRLVIFRQVVDDAAEVATKDLIFGDEGLLLGVSGGGDGAVGSAVVADKGHASYSCILCSDCGLHAGHLAHYRDACAADVNGLAGGAELRETFDYCDVSSSTGEPVGCCWAGDGGADDEDLEL